MSQGKYKYPITHQLIKDGRKNKVLNRKIQIKINVTMFHGQKDEVVPVSFSKKKFCLYSQKQKKNLSLLKEEITVYQKLNHLNVYLLNYLRLLKILYKPSL